MIAALKTAPKKIPHVVGTRGKIITFGSPKGGVGKSTLAVAMAAELGRRCEGGVVLVDLDRTGNAYKHISRSKMFGPNGELPHAPMPVDCQHASALVGEKSMLFALLNDLCAKYQFVVIDTPGAIENPGASFAMSAADLLIVPLRAAPYDLEATRDVLGVIAQIKFKNSDQEQMIVVNAPERTAVSQAAFEQIIIECESVKAYFAATRIRKCVGHQDSAGCGAPLWALGSSAKNASADVAKLVDESLLVMNQSWDKLKKLHKIAA